MEKITILINGYHYEDVYKPEEILLSFFLKDWTIYQFMSKEALQLRLSSLISLIQELIPKLNTTTKKTFFLIKNMIKTDKSKNDLIAFIANFLLAKEGLGLLHGFGCAITEKASKGNKRVKKQLNMNPEKQAMKFL